MNTAPQDKEKQNEPAAEGPEAEGPEAEGPEAEGEASTLPKRRFNIFILLPLLIFIGMAGLFGYQMKFGSNPHDVPSVLINKAAPDFDLAALDASFGIRRPDGGIIPGFKTADFSGKVSVVNVWASWCPTCRDEHPLLIELTNDDRFDLIGLAYKDEPANSARFLKNHGNPFDKIGMDISGRVGIDWGVYGAPETFIVDNKGIIRYKHIGALTKRSLEDSFLPKLEEILAEAN
ncbi:DsbE family thiol:disulfide interchange protein [uncultured Cohaesibacter sp.]|uniref:DsbE family thiol:disulfide interchange protein n=1 Tax=uncultured Cohaesibacter sp. TaxID=1002546 RepID=UPI002AABBFD3|nr:DsbE family thiol:disulfide interchange protein [uncultured Cohaesibacter sp.]